MSISTTIKHALRAIIFTLVLVTAPPIVNAQQEMVHQLRSSTKKLLQTDVFAYAGGGMINNGNLWLANNNTNAADKDLHGTYLDAGLQTEFFLSGRESLRLNTALGYKHEVYAYDKRLGSTGVHTHWLSADLNMTLSYFGAGIRSDIFLNSTIKNNDHFSYEGLYGKCFNPASLCYYASFNIRFTRMKLEARLGSYIKPQLNPDKIAYYNLHKSYVEGLYFEARLQYRLFTTGKVYQSPDFY